MNKKIGVALVFTVVATVLTYIIGAVFHTEPTALDVIAQRGALSVRGPILNEIFVFITHLSDTKVIVAFCIILLALPNRKKYGIPVTLSALGGLAIYQPMKHLFLRERPDVIYHLVEQGGYSFPSGHSVTSIIVYGLLFYLIGRYCENKKIGNFLRGICLFLAITIGPSRIFVGVHWLTDVLTGWSIGIIVLMIAITVIENREERKLVKA